MEPRAATPGRRLEALRQLSAAGIPTSVMVAPVIPAINDMEIERILDAAAHAGVKEASYVLLRLPLEVRDLFREWLLANYPDRYRHVFTLIREMRGQLAGLPEYYYYFGGLADKIEGAVLPIDKPNVLNYTRYEPVGVVAAIVPWNSPLLLAAWKLGAIPVPGNPMYKAAELARIFADSEPSAVICHDDCLAETREALAQAGVERPLLHLGLPDVFVEHGDPAALTGQAPRGGDADQPAAHDRDVECVSDHRCLSRPAASRDRTHDPARPARLP